MSRWRLAAFDAVVLLLVGGLFGWLGAFAEVRHNVTWQVPGNNVHISSANDGTTTTKGEDSTMAEKATATAPNTSTWKQAGRNVRFQQIDGMLFIAVDTSPKSFQGVVPTAKGNFTIASTLGNVAVTDTLKMGLNIYGPPPAQ